MDIDWNHLKEIVEPLKMAAELIALVIGSIWGTYKLVEFRELKHHLQFDIDAKIYRLTEEVNAAPYTWDKDGKRSTTEKRMYTHAVEILLRFENKSKRRFRLYNLQVSLYTIPEESRIVFDDNTGRLKLERLLTSGNVVPPMPVSGRDFTETSFYYIEPGVSQTISYVTLVSQPRDLLQVAGTFNMAPRRLFPEAMRTSKGPYPHTSSRTFKVDSESHGQAPLAPDPLPRHPVPRHDPPSRSALQKPSLEPGIAD